MYLGHMGNSLWRCIWPAICIKSKSEQGQGLWGEEENFRWTGRHLKRP